MFTRDELEARKVNDLRTLCKDRGLKSSGKKAELVQRLLVPDKPNPYAAVAVVGHLTPKEKLDMQSTRGNYLSFFTYIFNFHFFF